MDPTGSPAGHTRLTRGSRAGVGGGRRTRDRKSTRLNSSHANISYAVFCLKKKIGVSIVFGWLFAIGGMALFHDNVDRKSTRLNSSKANISYSVFCLKKKK